ncbi:MAG: hypothetical protein Q4C61_14020 [Lachnospiraceae bacterium]|nr:hypothetical protein [Lachnospiraceae bacterium]
MLTALDQIANQNHLQLIKAALPYIPSENQKMLSVCIKMIELHNIMSFYDHSNFSVAACSAQTEQPGMLDILADIRNYCEGEEQALLDQWIQIISAMELYSVFSQAPDSSEPEP